MITIDPIYVCDVPLSRKALGFPQEGDRANAVLLVAQEMRSETQAAYQRARHIHEGICISSCAENVFAILEQMQLRWCPWPDQGFTLAVLEQTSCRIRKAEIN